MKKKKPTLKEQFLETFPLENVPYDPEGIWKFFEPHLKKTQSAPKIEIPADRIKEYNQLWPEGKLPTGKYGRCSESELTSAFTWFFKVHPQYMDWGIILEAARQYLSEREQENWDYTSRSKYFIRKQLQDKSFTSNLSEYYERVLNNIKDEPVEEEQGFQPRVV